MNNRNGRAGIIRETQPQSEIVRRNFQAVTGMQQRTDAARSKQERIADWITMFSGSMGFVYLHAIWFAVWILLNVGLLDIPYLTQFDPYPFGLLTLVVSLEAIFLSTFVLISQNRQARIAERRTELDLQINLLSEQKTAKIIEMLDRIVEQLNAMNNSFHVPHDSEAAALKVSPPPEEVMQVIDDCAQEENGQAEDRPEQTPEACAAPQKPARNETEEAAAGVQAENQKERRE